MFRRMLSSTASIGSKSSTSSSYLPTHHDGTSLATSSTTRTAVTLPFLSNDKASAKSSAPSNWRYRLLVLTFLVYSIYAGWYVSTRPKGKWKSPFSWHPFLMTTGMTGSMGIAAVTKKLGGYTNTKIHGMLASFGYLLALGGLAAIYHNKNLWNKAHFTSAHGKIGIAVMGCTLAPLLAGAVALHPDFGIDRTNKTIRKVHKVFSRILMAIAWGNSLYGLYGMRKQHPQELLLYGIPLVILMPLTLI
mmetsp:Transcript_25365/g.59391  ORF Transcript_25365/g.59391 Transcript_25365/m.59391 type:complete len:247 (+) Transcript_25365:519-1259(+)